LPATFDLLPSALKLKGSRAHATERRSSSAEKDDDPEIKQRNLERLTSGLKMTPGLAQAIKLLQLSRKDLIELVARGA